MSTPPSPSTTARWWHYPLAIGLVVLAAVALWFLVRFLWATFTGLQKEVAAALVAGSATILVSVISVIATRYYERKRIIDQQLRERKMPMYEKFIDFWMRYMLAENLGKPQATESELQDFIVDFTKELLVWGSDEVVSEWSRFRRTLSNMTSPDEVSTAMLFQFERMLLSMRREFGHTNRKLKTGDILGLYINDIDEYLPRAAS
jgi:hypothetical protein